MTPGLCYYAPVEINILIDEEFKGHLDASWLRDLAQQALAIQGIGPSAELGLFITGQERVRELNLSYRGKDAFTDVLAFPMMPAGGEASAAFVPPPDGLHHLGEVIISYPQAVIQAGEQGHPVDREIAILLIHGILHLLGYDDQYPELKEKMRAREREILSRSEIN
ncbi:rRNA maturation RNase YbeY [Chloroflexota bacterium]